MQKPPKGFCLQELPVQCLLRVCLLLIDDWQCSRHGQCGHSMSNVSLSALKALTQRAICAWHCTTLQTEKLQRYRSWSYCAPQFVVALRHDLIVAEFPARSAVDRD